MDGRILGAVEGLLFGLAFGLIAFLLAKFVYLLSKRKIGEAKYFYSAAILLGFVTKHLVNYDFLVTTPPQSRSERTIQSSQEHSFQIVTPHEWANYSDADQSIYFKGALETVIFHLYSKLPKNDLRVQQLFSDYQLCFQKTTPIAWRPTIWNLGADLQSSVAHIILKNRIPLLCSEFQGKGNGAVAPIRLVSDAEWAAFSPQQRKIYITAYVETALEFFTQDNAKADAATMLKCINSGGLETISETLSVSTRDVGHPL